MKNKCRWQWFCAVGLGLAVGTSSGCQTWVGGMTLPSGRYLQHPPQYIPPSPAFPLPRELASQEAAAAAARPAAAPAPQPLPPPAPVVPAPPAE